MPLRRYLATSVLVVLCLVAVTMASCSTEQVQQELEATELELGQTQLELEQVEAEIIALQLELSELQTKYPPRRFPNGEVLQTWLENNATAEKGESYDALVWLARALEQQEQAAKDGYIISIELTTDDDILYSVYSTAVVENNGFWWWDCEIGEAYYWLDVEHF